MELFDVISENEIVRTRNIQDKIETNGFSCDTRTMVAGNVFFALPGANDSGEAYALQAAQKGACAVVAGEDFNISLEIPTVIVSDVRACFARACFFAVGNPQKKIKIVGVTGTNGKTTITSLMHKIITDAGKKCAMFTTVGYDVCGAYYPSTHTTPPPEKLAPLFAQALENGAEYAVMEVSSHSIAQKRVCALDFEVGIFTNISRDHLDYHKTMDEYARTKGLFFAQCENSVINLDDERAREMASNAKNNVFFLSAKDESAHYLIKDSHLDHSGMKYTIEEKSSSVNIEAPLAGTFNIYNTAEAFIAAKILGIDEESIKRTLSRFCGAPGRMEYICREKLPFSVIIDYAHTPDALEKAIAACKKVTRGTLYCLFGCGGNRDRGKRLEMGKIATDNADIAVITSDNPRNEEPESIIADIVSGVDVGKTNFVTVTDRKEAIEYALSHAKEGDTILLAGKGHENYIDDKNGKRYFSEKEIVEKFTERIGF